MAAPDGHVGGSSTLSGAEAAALLRHVALMAAATDPDPDARAHLLDRVWIDSRDRADRAAVLEVFDSLVRASDAEGLHDFTPALRLEMARAWLERGEPTRARLLVADLERPSVRAELAFALEGRAAGQRIVDAGYDEADEIDPDLVFVEARWGDVASAADQIEGLEIWRRCDPAVALRMQWTCSVVAETMDLVDPTDFDVPLATAAEDEAAQVSGPWEGCPALMAELAARRGDRRLAQRFLVRDTAETVQIDATENPRLDWSAHVRIGREDPFASHVPLYRVFDLLLLARILDERPDARIEGAQLAKTLQVDREEAPAQSPR